MATAYEELQKISFDKQKREEYNQRQKALYDYNSLISQATNEGIEQGIEQNKIEVAKNALRLGLPIDKISELTKLTIEQINKIKTTI